MTQTDNYGRRLTLRLPEELATEIEEYTNGIGMTFTEFLRRACREKLDRDSGRSVDQDDIIEEKVLMVLKKMGYKDKRGEM